MTFIDSMEMAFALVTIVVVMAGGLEIIGRIIDHLAIKFWSRKWLNKK